jgi:hypothetical protein
MQHVETHRVRYPLRAKVAIAGAGLLFLAELAAFALFMMPMIPLVPVFILTMLGNAFMLSSVLEWAASQRTVVKLKVPSAEPEARDRHRPPHQARAT